MSRPLNGGNLQSGGNPLEFWDPSLSRGHLPEGRQEQVDLLIPSVVEDAASGYSHFAQFCPALGFRLKPSKAKPPSAEQKLLGVVVREEDEGIRIAPGQSKAPSSDR